MALDVSMRLSAAWPALLANMQFAAIAGAFGCKMEVTDDVFLGWVEKEGEVISKYYSQAFKAYTGEDCVVTAVHGGLECADFAEWNENLQIISVGPSIIGPHSTSETIPVSTIVPTIGSIATLLGYIADGLLIN
jgi:di/tripeptidase